MPSVVRFVRNLLTLLAAGIVVLYVSSLTYLFFKQRKLLFVGGRQPEPIGASYHLVQLTEHDGTKIAAWHAPPIRTDTPVIVFFYGNAGTISDFAAVGELFRSEGYGILLASYRGYFGNSGTPSESGLMEDGRAALHWLPSRSPKVLWGQSLGTGVAVRLAPEGYASALILQSPYTSVADVAAALYPAFPVRWLIKDKFDNLPLAPTIKVPVLIVHGTADEIIPFAFGAKLAKAFPNATFVPISGAPHNMDESVVIPVARDWLHNTAKLVP